MSNSVQSKKAWPTVNNYVPKNCFVSYDYACVCVYIYKI